VEVTASPGQTKSFKLVLKNLRKEDEFATPPAGEKAVGFVLEEIWVAREDQVVKVEDKHELADPSIKKMVRLKANMSYKIDVKVTCGQVGHYRAPVMVSFYHDTMSPVVVEGRVQRYRMSHLALEVLLRVQTEDVRSLQPTTPYVQSRRRLGPEWVRAKETLPGRKTNDVSVLTDNLRKDVELEQFLIGPVRSKLIMSDFRDDGEDDNDAHERELLRCRDLLERSLEVSNYRERWELLLHCEEKQLELDIRHYDMEGVTMEVDRRLNLFKLRVPGLQENRPSVIRGDRIYARMVSNTEREYEGIVHEIREDSVMVGFNQKLVESFITNMKFNVRFTIGRFPLRNMHRAVSLASVPHLQATLFPGSEHISPSPSLQPTLRCYNRMIEQNAEQLGQNFRQSAVYRVRPSRHRQDRDCGGGYKAGVQD